MATEFANDTEILRQIQKGDTGAFAYLVRRDHLKYYHLAYRYMLDVHEAEDIVQTAFLKLWKNPKAWNEKKETKFSTWFYRVVVNLCLDRLKKHKALPIQDGDDWANSDPSQEQVMIEKQQKQVMDKAVLQLPKRQKTALILCFYQGLSHQDAAKVMKINLKALQSLLMRAKTTLKEQIGQKGLVR